MDLRLFARLRCPTCKSELELKPFEEGLPGAAGSSAENSEPDRRIIKDGCLLCHKCRVWYPVSSYVPVMLVFKTRFHTHFAARFQARLAEIGGYDFPRGVPQPGERSVQETFTEEWETLNYDDLSFGFSREELRQLHGKVWLKQKEGSSSGIESVLNVGVGFGIESEVLQAITGAELFAVDLNFSVLQKGEQILSNPKLHFVIASLFNVPFEEKSFDLVYSQGVLMHTHDTQKAFNSIAKFVKERGQLFVWVTAIDDVFIHRWPRRAVTMTFYCSSLVLRPVLSRSPSWVRRPAIFVLSVLLHPLLRMRGRHGGKWKLPNSEHLLRDYFTPRYVHMCRFNDVIEWFESLQFDCQVQSAVEFRRIFGKAMDGIGILGVRSGYTTGQPSAL
ncbi:MAG TPA: methyltransferase domain-containing protein [Terracidiphilus sp.]|nr:methyltransferase domain-containing protein [Terracidiphilus sp.]